MQWNRFFLPSLTFVVLTGVFHADCIKKQDHRSNKNAGVLVNDLVISGTQTISSDELNRIRGNLIGGCFDEDSEQLQERIRALFQNRGYFAVVVKSLNIKSGDPLVLPKPVALEAEVEEGPLYRLAGIKFSGNRALSAAQLRTAFPLKKADLFDREKIAAGLDRLRVLYAKHGFLDFICVPDTEFSSNATILLTMSVVEGAQYHLGKLHILAKKEVDKLRARWQLPEGGVFDRTYIDKYVRDNRSLLPAEFTADSVQVWRDCPAATVEVTLPLDANEVMSHTAAKNVDCESAPDKTD
jgi:outer membrane protein insertion porin family